MTEQSGMGGNSLYCAFYMPLDKQKEKKVKIHDCVYSYSKENLLPIPVKKKKCDETKLN